MVGKESKGPRYLVNKVKPKGLQRLRWFCQMCRKQCRDAAGFKCHASLQSHQQQLRLASDISSKNIEDSKEFADGYLEFLHRQYGTKRVHANKVYQEYISDKDRCPVNMTQWVTLTEFVMWLEREGKCVLDDTEKGWAVTYRDKEAEAIAAKEAKIRRDKMDREDQKRMLEFINSQAEKGLKAQMARENPKHSGYGRRNHQDKAYSNLYIKRKTGLKRFSTSPYAPSRTRENPKRMRAMAMQIYEMASQNFMTKLWEAADHKSLRQEQWVREGIVVKIITSKLGEEFNRKKGAVVSVGEDLTATVDLGKGKKQDVPQKYLETVIPSQGRKVIFVNGHYMGAVGVLKRIDLDDFCCEVEIIEGPDSGRLIRNVQYEDVSKMATY